MAKLIFPQEIEVWYILPAIRKKIALKLIEKMPQKDVAKLMCITPAAVSQYKKKKRAKVEIFDKEMEQELEKSIEKIIKNHKSLANEIIYLNNQIKKKGIVCKIYNKICALNLDPKNCPYCRKK